MNECDKIFGQHGEAPMMIPHVHKIIMRGGVPQRTRVIFFSSPTFQGKSDVKASKNCEVSSQSRMVQLFISSK
jgi:hypothetical protein